MKIFALEPRSRPRRTAVLAHSHVHSDINEFPPSRLAENIHTYVKPSEYMDKLSAHSLIRITAVASVQGTEQMWSQDDDFAVQKPQLTVRVSV